MQPSIWTSVYIEDPTPKALKRLHAQGWRACELSCEHIGVLTDDGDEAAIEAVAAALKELGMAMPQAHLYLQANVVHSDESHREADLARALRELETCATLGVENAVIHPGGACDPSLIELRIRQFRRLADRAEALGVRIAIENMMDGRERQQYGARISELHDLIDAVGSDMLGICFDSSHANVQKLDLPQAVSDCGSRLIATHMSDNDGSGDQHKTPGYAQIDWVPVVQAMNTMGYTGVFNLEIPGERRCPQGVLDLKVGHAYDITCWLLSSGQ